MSLLPELIAVAILQFLVIIAPGPDFVVICRNSLVYSRRAGIYSALGLTLGILVHASYSLIEIHTPVPVQIWYGLQMGIMTFVWYASVAIVMSHPVLKERLLSVTHYLEKAMGAVLIALGIRVALSGTEK